MKVSLRSTSWAIALLIALSSQAPASAAAAKPGPGFVGSSVPVSSPRGDGLGHPTLEVASPEVAIEQPGRERTRKGELITVEKDVPKREAYLLGGGGEVIWISIPAGTRLRAATDELSGNVYTELKLENGRSYVAPIANGEWTSSARPTLPQLAPEARPQDLPIAPGDEILVVPNQGL